MTYEVLLVEEDEIYYIRYYPEGMEFKGIDLKLSREEYLKWIEGKREI